LHKSGPLPFIARGALGGVPAGFITWLLAVLSDLLRLGYIPYPYLYILAIPLALLLGVVVGAIVGTAIWILGVVTGREFGSIARAIIGFAIALIAIELFALIRPEQRGLAHEPLSWTRHAINWLMTGIILGALPGLMASAKHRESTP